MVKLIEKQASPLNHPMFIAFLQPVSGVTYEFEIVLKMFIPYNHLSTKGLQIMVMCQ